MNKLLIFIILLAVTSTVSAQTDVNAAVTSNHSQAQSSGHLLQTTGPHGQSIRWYRQSQPKFLLELQGLALYPSLQQQALQQFQAKSGRYNTAAQQQAFAQNVRTLAGDKVLVKQLQQQIESEQQQVAAAVQLLSGAKVEQHFSRLNNMLLVSGPMTQAQLAAISG